MRKSLLVKLTICYICLIISIFIFLNTYGVNQLMQHNIASKRNMLYTYANHIKDSYFSSYYFDNVTVENVSKQLGTTDICLNTDTWILRKNGELLTMSSEIETSSKPRNINDYSKDFLGKPYHINAEIEGLLSEPMLSVILPITMNFDVKGYIVVHTPMSVIRNATTYYTNLSNIAFLILAIILLCLLGYIYYITIKPLKTLIKATHEYSSGHFDYPLTITSHDEYKELCDAITYMAGELNSLDDYQKKFVANISHDFRSPLTSIKGYSEAMLDGTIPSELHEKYLDIIQFEAERLTKLTSNLLALNNFENNGTLLDITSFDINKTIKRIAASFEGSCTKKKLKVKLIFSEKQMFVDADMGKIQQVLYNLLDNSIKFSHEDSEIRISTIDKHDKVFVSVKDYGIGIPKESVKKIWDRFYKTDVSRGKDKKGTGLGLSITKEIINAHGENINVISTVDVGTEFIFTLQRTSEEDDE